MFWAGFKKESAYKLKSTTQAKQKGGMGFKPVAVPTSGKVKAMASSKPSRVTTSIMPGNPIKGLRGLTGKPAAMPWKKILRRGR